jgi:hypothetical protein
LDKTTSIHRGEDIEEQKAKILDEEKNRRKQIKDLDNFTEILEKFIDSMTKEEEEIVSPTPTSTPTTTPAKSVSVS